MVNSTVGQFSRIPYETEVNLVLWDPPLLPLLPLHPPSIFTVYRQMHWKISKFIMVYICTSQKEDSFYILADEWLRINRHLSVHRVVGVYVSVHAGIPPPEFRPLWSRQSHSQSRHAPPGYLTTTPNSRSGPPRYHHCFGRFASYSNAPPPTQSSLVLIAKCKCIKNFTVSIIGTYICYNIQKEDLHLRLYWTLSFYCILVE